MKILILANNDVGLYKFRRELIERLLEGNSVLISLPYGPFVDKFVSIGCSFVDTPLSRRGKNIFREIKLFRLYKKLIKKTKPDLVITYTIKPNIYGGYACLKNKTKYCANITGLGSAFQKNGLLKKLVVFFYRKSLRKASTVFFENSENLSVFLTNRIITDNQACLLNGAGVNLSFFKCLDYPKEAKPVEFLFIGRVMKEKGVEELFRAMELLIEEGLNARLHVVGPMEDNYSALIEEYEKSGWLIYYGFQDDVRPFILKSHCFVLPSWHEGMANTILECAASGRPVITTNIPGCKEGVVDGVSGYLCEKKNYISLHNAMYTFANLDSTARINMGLLGRKYIEKKFDKRDVVEKTIAALFDKK